MRNYPDQPAEVLEGEGRYLASMDEIRSIIQATLQNDLPECETNEWFMASVNFPNMLDRMMQDIWNNV